MSLIVFGYKWCAALSSVVVHGGPEGQKNRFNANVVETTMLGLARAAAARAGPGAAAEQLRHCGKGSGLFRPCTCVYYLVCISWIAAQITQSYSQRCS